LIRPALHAGPLQLVPFLTKQLGQACAQILSRLSTGILANLHALAPNRLRLVEKFLANRLAKERLDLA
jgi:hypothetical protein